MTLILKIGENILGVDAEESLGAEMFKEAVLAMLKAETKDDEEEETVLQPKHKDHIVKKEEKEDLNMDLAKNETNSAQSKGYRGFMHLVCPKCGSTRSFAPKSALNRYFCKDCGASTELDGLAPVHFTCPNCGKNFKYLTNILDHQFTMTCLSCGSPVDIEYNDKKSVYEGMK